MAGFFCDRTRLRAFIADVANPWAKRRAVADLLDTYEARVREFERRLDLRVVVKPLGLLMLVPDDATSEGDAAADVGAESDGGDRECAGEGARTSRHE